LGKFPHVHCFRLSDEDERRYQSILRRFRLDLRSQQSSTFRLLLKKLSQLFSEMDSMEPTHSENGQIRSAAHWQPGTREIQELDGDEDKDSEWDKQMKIVQENYHKVKRLTYEALRKEGLPFTQGNIDRKFQEIKKELGLITSAHEIEF